MVINRKYILAWIFILYGSIAGAGEEWSGSASIFGSTMPWQNYADVNKNSAGLDLKLQSNYILNRSFRMQFSPWIVLDPANISNEEKKQFEIQDLFFELKSGLAKLRVGFVSETWEGTDFINPMDIVNPRNYRDPLRSEKRSSPGFFYSDQVQKVSWDVVYIPKQSKSLLPGEKSPWWPRQISLPLQNDQVFLLLPETVSYQITSDEILDHALDHNVAARIQFHGDSMDTSLAGFEGSASPPLLIPTVNGVPLVFSPTQQIYQLQSPILITPNYFRERISAAAFTYTYETWILRLAVQYIQPLGTDTRVPSWSESGVLEIEKSLHLASEDITMIFQTMDAKSAQSGSLSALSSLTQKSYMLGWRWPFRENWSWLSAFFQEQKSFSTYIHNEISWVMTDHWKQELIVDLLDGSAESALGTYKKNDRIQFQVSYLF